MCYLHARRALLVHVCTDSAHKAYPVDVRACRCVRARGLRHAVCMRMGPSHSAVRFWRFLASVVSSRIV